MKKVLFIVNPVAGKKKILNALEEVDKAFYDGGCQCDIYFTKKRGDATEKVVSSAENYDIVVCGGGDGTYNELITGVRQKGIDIPVGYIPAGSTNDFATTLGISNVPKKAAENIVSGTPNTLDIGKFGDSYFSYVASFGAFTAASYSTSQKTKNRLGHMAYILGGAKDLGSIKPYTAKIEADGKVYEGDFLFGAVSNSTSIAGMIKLDKTLVDLSDGLFEIVLIRMPKHITQVPGIFLSLKKGNYSNKYIEFFHASSIKVETEKPLEWALDGEHATSCGEILVENIPGAINLIL